MGARLLLDGVFVGGAAVRRVRAPTPRLSKSAAVQEGRHSCGEPDVRVRSRGQRLRRRRPRKRTAAAPVATRAALPRRHRRATVLTMSTLGQALALAPDVRDGLTSAVEAYGQRTRERGARYVREGRVASLTLGDGTIDAVVQGDAPYRVHWRRAERDGRRPWIAQCSCPVGIFCKHAYAVAALLLGEAIPGINLAGRRFTY